MINQQYEDSFFFSVVVLLHSRYGMYIVIRKHGNRIFPRVIKMKFVETVVKGK